jgi:hypothetical protein
MFSRTVIRSYITQRTVYTYTTMSSLPFKHLKEEAELAILATLRACRLCVFRHSSGMELITRTKQVQDTHVSKDTVIKKDKSPVTGQLNAITRVV